MDVKTLCLGALTMGDMTGYDIKKVFEEAFSYFFVAGYGSIYPALGDLTRAGLVEGTDVAQAGKPDKKVYHLTERGRQSFVSALLETPPRHKLRSEFFVLLYFAHLLPNARLAEVLAQRERDIAGLIAHIDDFQRNGCGGAGPSLMAGMGRASLEAQLDYLRAHRDALIESSADAAG